MVIKRKRKATPVLFSLDVQKHIDLILNVRRNFVNDENKYIFAPPGSDNTIVGYRLFRKYAMLAGQRPDAISTTTLRKHLATIYQLFHMSNEDVEQLATFMRHRSLIHRSNYRLSDDIFQTTKITKLLLMMEKGEGAQYKGRPLDEIYIPLEDNLNTNCRNATNFSDSSDSANEYPEDIPLHDTLSGTSRNACLLYTSRCV